MMINSATTDCVILQCSRCGATATRKYGKRFVDGRKVQQYQCRGCGKVFLGMSGTDSTQGAPVIDSENRDFTG
jgi:transposase-like protein